MRTRFLLAALLALVPIGASAQWADVVPGPTSTPGFHAATHVPAASFGTLPLLYSNGGLATGTTTGSGVAVPTSGYQWSEVQADAGITTEGNGTSGFSCSVTTTLFRCADDFTVPAGQTWTVDAVSAFAYQTGYAGVPSPFVAATLQIWDGSPSDPGSTLLYGDATTNRLQTSFEASLYRVFNTTTPPPGTAPGTTRRIWENVMAVSPGLALPAGTYWVDFNFQIAGNAANFAPSTTIVGSRGTPGANAIQFTGAAWGAALDTGNPATAPDVAQEFPIQIYGTTTPPPTYTVTTPVAGTRIQAGAKTIVRWNGPGVPTSAAMADVYLRAPGGTLTLVGSGKNLGKLKVTVPAGTPTGSGYSFRVQLQSDPTVYGLSDAVAVFSPADQYTFAEPDPLETWQRGTPHTVLWTAPPGAPVGGTVTVTLLRRSGFVVSTFAGEPDDGSMPITTAANLAAGEFYFTIESDSDRAYFGRSAAFDIGRIQLTSPAEGATWAVGSSQTISWTTDGINIAGNVRQLSLRSVDQTYSRPLATNVPYANGTRTVTVPSSGNVPPAGQYYVQLLYQITSGAGVLTEIVVKSSPFTVTNPVTAPAPPVASRYFGSPEASADARETLLVVRGLTEGAEVGVYVTVGGDGGETLLAAGVVESGDALIAVPSETVVDSGTGDGAEDWYFGETSALTLRVFDGSSEWSVDARTVTLGSDGSALDGVRLASGDVVVVDASKGGAGGEVAAAVFAVAGVSPNPASSSAVVRFTSPSSAPATVVVYDLLGRAVQTAFSGMAQEGFNEVSVSTQALPAGVYVVRVTAGAESATTRFTVVR